MASEPLLIECEIPCRIQPEILTLLEKLANKSVAFKTKRERAVFLKYLKMMDQQYDTIVLINAEVTQKEADLMVRGF